MYFDSITLTEKAHKAISDALVKRTQGMGIRLAVKASGCVGLSYVLEFVDVIDELDMTETHNGLTVVSDPKSLLMLKGLTLDFVVEGFDSGFKFINPTANETCGCGKSFSV